MMDVKTKGGAEGDIGTNDVMIVNALSFFPWLDTIMVSVFWVDL
jgi:hypothetical protein